MLKAGAVKRLGFTISLIGLMCLSLFAAPAFADHWTNPDYSVTCNIAVPDADNVYVSCITTNQVDATVAFVGIYETNGGGWAEVDNVSITENQFQAGGPNEDTEAFTGGGDYEVDVVLDSNWDHYYFGEQHEFVEGNPYPPYPGEESEPEPEESEPYAATLAASVKDQALVGVTTGVPIAAGLFGLLISVVFLIRTFKQGG